VELLNRRGQPDPGSRASPGRTIYRLALALALLAPGLGRCLAEDLSSGDEYQVKALFLYNFAKFVEWPAAMRSGPICIGILGSDPFGDVLDRAVAGKIVNGRGFMVKRFSSEMEARQCHIVFVSVADKRRVGSIVEGLKGRGVLTVGDSHGFAESGGVINFVIMDDRVRFEVNIRAAEEAGLKLSSKLLSLAKSVRRSGF
jgi:hypothetical protein